MGSNYSVMNSRPNTPWSLVLIEGLFALLIGGLLIIYPGVTTVMLVQILGIFFLVKGVLSFAAIIQDKRGWFWKLLGGILSICAGFIIINHPLWSGLMTPFILGILMGLLAILVGTIALIQAVAGGGWGVGFLAVLAIFIGFFTLWGNRYFSSLIPFTIGALLIAGGLLAVLTSLVLALTVERKPKPVAVPQPEESAEPQLETAESTGEVEQTPASEELPEPSPAMTVEDKSAEILAVAEETSSAEMGTSATISPAVAAAGVGWALEEWEPEGASKVEEELETVGDLESPLKTTGIGVIVEETMQEDEITESTEESQPLVVDEVLVEEAGELLVDEKSSEIPTSIDEATEESADIDVAEVQQRLLDHDLEYVEGIGSAYAARLKAIGITSALDLLRQGATRRGRADIAEKTGISGKLILRWVNNADLYRIKGIGSEYAELLEASGVDTVVELSKRNPNNLYDALTATNQEKKLVRQVPTLTRVQDWIEQAKSLPRVIRY
jgi:uncharacterized membrane protein HdeD (DUF308 family)/predicted flap endonuclease-1-like 5' DNA nuclease